MTICTEFDPRFVYLVEIMMRDLRLPSKSATMRHILEMYFWQLPRFTCDICQSGKSCFGSFQGRNRDLKYCPGKTPQLGIEWAQQTGGPPIAEYIKPDKRRNGGIRKGLD